MSIRSRLLMLFLPLIALSLIGVTLVVDFHQREALSQATLHHLESVASIQKRRVITALAQRREELGLVASRTQMRRSLASYLHTGDPADQASMSQILNDALASIASFRSITLTDPNGLAVASTDPDLVGRNFHGEMAFAQGLKATQVSHLHPDPAQRASMTLSGPLQLDGELIGVILIESGIKDLEAAIHDYTGLGRTGETLLARRTGSGDAQFIAALRFAPQAALRQTIGASRTEVPMTQAMRGREEILRSAIAYHGRPVFAVTRYLEQPDWGLVVIQERSEALAPVQELRKRVALICLVILLIAAGLCISFAQSLSRPIRRLARLADHYRQGRWSAGDSTPDTATYSEVQTLRDALEQLKAAQAQLVERERLAALGDTVAGMVHEVNTPLGNAVTMSSTLRENLATCARQLDKEELTQDLLEASLADGQEASQIIERNLRHAAQLMRSYQTVAVDEASLASRDFDLRAYIDDVLVSLKPRTKRSPHEISVSGASQIGYHGTPGAISQIVSNLVMNSLRHAWDEGEAGHIALVLETDGSEICLRYRDDGRGIPPENRDRIFDKFFTTRRGSGGSGLGLHVIRDLIEKELGGSIRLVDSESAGTEFEIRFPTAAPTGS